MVITLETGTVIVLFHLEHSCKDLAQCHTVWQLIPTGTSCISQNECEPSCHVPLKFCTLFGPSVNPSSTVPPPLCVCVTELKSYEAVLVVVRSGFKWAARHAGFLFPHIGGWDMRLTAPLLWNLILARWKRLQRNQWRSVSETFEDWSACSGRDKWRLSRKWDFHVNICNSDASTHTRMCCSHSIIYHPSHRRSCRHKDGYFLRARSDSSW
jgi:hypothetical protein